ncbi:conjugal transfer protein TraG N-terminal domain-containing protein [Endozoicomonas sp. ALC066]|uniref:conjugal transfer protein TraG N-terminal domain-containing protein n=1 Tax=Endozoicomonas sp. ALC066 TaxID=3403078 RepID=UPI003BB734B7
MVVNSLPEIYTMSYGWYIYEQIWNVIAETGLYWVPFIFAIIKISVEARNSGADEGNAGGLAMKRIETQVLSMLFVIIFACIPFKNSGFRMSIDVVNLQSNIKECSKTPNTTIPENVKDAFVEVNDGVVNIPIFWGFVHSISSALTSAFIASLPCRDDIAFSMFELSESDITDRQLQKDIDWFYKECYSEAKARELSGTENLEKTDVDWLGAKHYMETNGYYDSIAIGPLDSSWTADSNFDNPMHPGQPYRSCEDYWKDATLGLESRIIDGVDQGVVDSFMDFLYPLVGAEDKADEKRAALAKSILSVTAIKKIEANTGLNVADRYNLNTAEGAITTSPLEMLGEVALTGIRGVVLFGQNIISNSEKFIYRESADYVLAIAQMILIVAIPLILLLGGFSFKVLAMTGVGYFALDFINFIWAFAFWLETTWMEAMRSDAGFDQNLQMLLDIISNTAYIGMPVIWLIILGWSGYRVSGVFEKSQNDAASSAKSIGNQAGNLSNPVNLTSGLKSGAVNAAGSGNTRQGNLF